MNGLSYKLQKRNSDVYHAYQINYSMADEVDTKPESVHNVWVEWRVACSLAKKEGGKPDNQCSTKPTECLS